jgi:hypothetical protein
MGRECWISEVLECQDLWAVYVSSEVNGIRFFDDQCVSPVSCFLFAFKSFYQAEQTVF